MSYGPNDLRNQNIGFAFIASMIAIWMFLLTALAAHADNINVTQGSGKVMATDDIGGVNFQRHKLIFGPDGTNEGDVSRTNPLPVTSQRSDDFSGVSANITGVTPVEAAPAAGSGVRYYIETFTVSNSSTTVGTDVELLDGATVKYLCPAGPVYGGCAVTFPTPIRGTANTAINCRNATTGAAVKCSVSGFKSSN